MGSGVAAAVELVPIGEGHPRDFVIMDNDNERGPDSVECTPGLISSSPRVWEHTDCFEDYSTIGGRFSNYGFRCGCGCHDVLPIAATEAAEAAGVVAWGYRQWWEDLTVEERQAFMTGATQ